jgi:MoxR-like ATPase
LLICAALIGRRVFLFTAAVVGAARLLGRGDTQTEPVPSAAIVAPVPAVRSSPEGTFEPPRGFDLPAIPDVSDVRAALERAVVGQSAAIEALMIGLIAGGHVVLEGAPGLGKTLACSTMARAVDATLARIQCHADLTPADVVGCEIFDQRNLSFTYRLGPAFANILLVDEINRAPARVQAALLEAMEERAVTIGTETRALPDPFFVLATMNEAESEGIFPLAAAQLDRFLLKIVLDFPTAEEDLAILKRRGAGAAQSSIARASLNNVRAWQHACRAIYCAPPLMQYAAEIVRATRAAAECGDLESGAGPRAGLALLRAARARAILTERNYVLPADVRSVACGTLRHRVTFAHSYLLARAEREDRLRAIIDRVPLP